VGLCLLNGWLVADPNTALAHQGQTVPVFKSRLDIVRTEVGVIDNKTGKAVTGLAERDFTISENGIRQAIATFIDESSPDAPKPANAVPMAAEQNRRVFLFDIIVNQFGDGPYKSFDGVAQFIRERLRPQDLVGVMVLNRVSGLTTDHERIARIVERQKVLPKEYRDAARSDHRLTGDYKPNADRILDAWLDPTAAPGFFQSATAFLLGTQEYQQNDRAGTIYDWNFRLNITEVLRAVAGIEYLRRAKGDKHFVMITGAGFNPAFTFVNEGIGLHYYDSSDDRRLSARANDAGVALDIISTVGSGGSLFAVMSMANVAEDSGGQYSSLRRADQQLARIDDATQRGYVLGYVPSNPEFDGKYRNIKVTVNRLGVAVVYRHGYTAAAEPERLDAKEEFARSRLREAAVGNTNFGDIGVEGKASAVGSAGVDRQVRVDLLIDISKLPLNETNGRWEGDLDLLILCGDKKQNVVGKLDQRMRLGMSATQYQLAKTGRVPYSAVLNVTGQATLLKVIVYHADSDRLGTTAGPIR
jgi:VWFA-related protein